jgi:hypothetical protein
MYTFSQESNPPSTNCDSCTILDVSLLNQIFYMYLCNVLLALLLWHKLASLFNWVAVYSGLTACYWLHASLVKQNHYCYSA